MAPKHGRAALLWPIRLALVLVGLSIAVEPPAVGAAARTTRVSVRGDNAQGNGDSRRTDISPSGRYVVFDAAASDLVNGDTNAVDDVFIRDQKRKRTRRISLHSNGSQGDGDSTAPSTSEDGRFVAFESAATTLVDGDTNGVSDVFVRDRRAGTTQRVSVRSNGVQGDGGSHGSSISADGRFVAFTSLATNLVAGDTNDTFDVFVHDRRTGTTRRVSVLTGGGQGDGASVDPSISASGRLVAFVSDATNLVNGDTNGLKDVFVHDRKARVTERVSVRPNGTQGNDESRNPEISGNGSLVAFESTASNLVAGDTNGRQDVFVHIRASNALKRVSVRSNGAQGNDDSAVPAISDDGRVVAFESDASNLVPSDTNTAPDVFIHDRRTKKTKRASVRSNGAQASAKSEDPALTADGRFVAFESAASDLVNADTNGSDDVFRRGPF